MYRRITSKLFNTTTRSVKVRVKIVKPKAPSKPKEKERKPKEKRKPKKEEKKPKREKRKPKKEERKPLRAKCPHLRSDKTCAMMVKEGLDGRVSDVDIKHFCNGNPLLCYYFRLSASKKKK